MRLIDADALDEKLQVVRKYYIMCREKRITIDYDDYDFTKVW